MKKIFFLGKNKVVGCIYQLFLRGKAPCYVFVLNALIALTIGTRLPNYKKGTFQLLGKKYKMDPRCVYRLGNHEVTGEDIVRVARSLLNVPYLWGGKNIMGFDCSGFTQMVYSVFGINLLRNAREQVTQGQMMRGDK